jgi:DNA-binding SARP family transcriptional activator/WD40 repeat protein
VYLLQTLGAVALHAGLETDPGSDPILRSSKTLVLVAYLADRPDRTATREHLAELFWPGVPSSSARRSLRQALYFLARSGGEGLLETDGDLVRYSPDRCAIDSQRFEHALAEHRYEDAAGLYTGPFLEGWDPGRSQELRHWIDSVRERLAVGYRQALRECAQTALVRQRPAEAVECARLAVAAFPLDDSVHALLLESLVADGRPGEAVREYEAYRVLLREELEDLPSEAVNEIGERARQLVLGQSSEPEAAGGTTEPAPVPASPLGPTPDRRRTPDSRKRSGPGILIRAMLFVAVTAAIFLLVLRGSDWLFGGGGMSDPESLPAEAGTSGDRWISLRVTERTPDGPRPVTLRFVGEAPDRAVLVPGSEGEVGSLAFRSPDGRYLARRVRTPNGPDLEIVDASTGERVAVVPNRDGGTPDDHAHDWSPDSGILLMSSGMFAEDGSYDHRHFLFDVETGVMRPLADRRVAPSRSAGWSPRGDRIAFEGFRDGAGIADIRTDLFLASVDGREVRALTDDDLREQNITWSPDGRRLAYVKGDLETGGIHVMDPSTGEERPVAASVWPEVSPEWISDDEIAYLEMHDEGPRLMVKSVRTDTPARRIPVDGDVRDLLQRLEGGEPAAWIESVTASAHAPDGTLSPGSHAALDVTILDSRGAIVHPDDCEFEWRVLEPYRAAIVENRLLAVRDTGTIRVVADVGGWRADTLTLVSKPLAIADTELLFEENWQAGIRPEAWRVFGEPPPTTRADGGPDGGGRFLNRGDRNHTSGVLTRDQFPTAGGITVESWGRVPTTDEHFQTWQLDVAGDPMLQPGTDERSRQDQTGRVVLVSSVSKGGPTAFLGALDFSLPVPEPAGIDDWRLHSLQLHTDGTVEWIVDGRRHAVATSGSPPPDSVHVAIGGHSQGSEIEHGAVRVWRGHRYVPQ